MKNPYIVPRFDAGQTKTQPQYFWWSWHPCYPYWSKSCWGGHSIDEAWDKISKPIASSMRYYHNKLIKEMDGKFIEVADLPCQDLKVWQAIARDKNNWRKPSDAKPIKNWDK